MKNVLVTGGAGFIASHLVPLLAESGVSDLRVVDLRTPAYLKRLSCAFSRQDLARISSEPEVLRGVDTVFHLAWASVPESSVRAPARDVISSLVPTIILLEQCVLQGIKRVIFVSTGGAIYGLPTCLPVSETHLTQPISAYGISKLAAEKYLSLFRRLYGLEYVIMRPSVPYGEHQNPFGRQGAVAVFLGNILKGEPITIWGDPKEIVRDFFHVEDLARACILAARLDKPESIYNLGAGVGLSLSDLIKVLAEIVAPTHPFQVQTLPPRPFDVPKLVLDISNARRSLGWQPEVDLVSGLRRTWDWVHSVPMPAESTSRT